jgi:RNA polymerase sigma-70 factor, ECF subfamily
MGSGLTMIASLELSLPHSSIARTSVAGTSVANPASPNDEELAIARTLKGDLDAFNELVLKYERIAYSVAYRMLQSSDAASDAVQESFIKAYRALPSFKNGSFKSWLMRIVINTCYDAIRSNRRFTLEEISDDSLYEFTRERGEHVPHQLVDPHESPQDFVERMEFGAQIELGLRSLPHEQRMVLVLYDIHGYSYEEISEITSMAMGTVKSRISRARQKLRDFLLQQGELESFGSRN